MNGHALAAMRLIGLLFTLLAAARAGAEKPPAAAVFEGPFLIEDGISFFIVNPGGEPFTAVFRWRDGWREHQPRPLLIRVFDPEERIVARHEFEGARVADRNVPWESVRLEIPACGEGVYQIVACGMGIAELDLNLAPGLEFGVMGHPEWLIGKRGQFQEAFIHLPPGLDELRVRTRGELSRLVVEDESGGRRLELRGGNPAGAVKLPAASGSIWRMKIESPGECRLTFDGVPVILCPSPESARAIGGGVTVLEDGTICFHRFQERAWRLLQRYRQLPHEAFHVPLPRLIDHREAWLRDPQRNMVLLGHVGVYANLPPVLHEQNLDPSSPWFGSIHVWRGIDADRRPRLENPHATYDRLDTRFRAEQAAALAVGNDTDRVGGGIHMGREAALFAALYTLDDPLNPLHRHPGLMNRIAIAMLQDLMMIRKHELLIGRPTSFAGGMRAFSLERHLEMYALIADHLPEDVRDVATDGMRRLVDRSLISHVGGTVNQWAAIPVGIYSFYQGSGEPYYRDWVMRHMQWIAGGDIWGYGQKPAGYPTESEGPDATYTGITTTLLAFLYNEMREPLILDVLQRALDLFNHTIAPDPFNPRGPGVGASDFCHRTAGDWWSPQGMYGGLSMMADHLPEAGLREGLTGQFPRLARTPVERRAAERRLTETLRQPYMPVTFFDRAEHPLGGSGRISSSASHYLQRFRHFPQDPKPGELPMVASERFSRNFGDEFFAVRRPAYYALIYAGRPMGTWQRARRPLDPNVLFPRNGGGLSMLWSPRLGASVLGKNWAAYTSHALIATGSDGRVDWEDYWSVTNRFTEADEESCGARLVVSGAMRDRPLAFRKTYSFEDDGIEAIVTVTAAETHELASFEENLPLRLDERAQIRAIPLDENGERLARGNAGAPVRAVMIHHPSAQEVHLIVFDQPRPVQIRRWGSRDGSREWSRLSIALPTGWTSGQERTFRSIYLVCDRQGVGGAIRKAILRWQPEAP